MPTPVKQRPSEALKAHRARVRAIVESHRASNARVFGSVLHGHDTEGSDLDILVDPMPGMTLFDIGRMRCELLDLLGIEVDIRTPQDLPPKFRMQVVNEAKPI